jgi:hypothetical protein
VLRDALLWAFPKLPDPFLSFQASACNSSTKIENALVLGVLDRVLTLMAGRKCAAAWATESGDQNKSPERLKSGERFDAHWERMTPEQRQRRDETCLFITPKNQAWRQVQDRVQRRCGNRALRAGRMRFTSSQIIDEVLQNPMSKATAELTLEG